MKNIYHVTNNYFEELIMLFVNETVQDSCPK